MRFQEPRLLVERAGEGGEEVRCINIPGFVGGVDRYARLASSVRAAIDRGRKVIRRRAEC